MTGTSDARDDTTRAESVTGPAADADSTETAQNNSGRVAAAAAAKAGFGSIYELTGKQPEGVTAVEPTKNGWLIAVEVIEDQRVPSSADLLATYEAELGNDGTLLAYRRTRRYARGRGDGRR
ncbi:MAG: gas vesicle protein [Candidatus Dormibacteraeota bacterium]|nr:gas vesicle protein [Candidatus Dormibacteraeota bacterium]